MSTKMGNMRRAILSGVVGAMIATWGVGLARADVASDKPGAILIYPKIVVDTSGIFGPPTDTEIQITNTSNSVIAARCYLVNATSHCSNAPAVACTAETEATIATRRCPPGGACLPQWSENDFRMTLTKRQPVSWKASEGLPTFPCDVISTTGCPFGQSNTGSDGLGSSVPPTAEDPFFGEIKCVEVDPNDFKPTRGFNPANDGSGDLKGEATIVATGGFCGGGVLGAQTAPDGKQNGAFCTRDVECFSGNCVKRGGVCIGGPLTGASCGIIGSACGPTNSGTCFLASGVDARKYNAIALEATAVNDRDDTLRIGGADPEYNACPNVLIMNHMFDDSFVFSHDGFVAGPLVSDLTVIPCSEDFLNQENNLGGATMQFLVFNEFEQRFSTSTSFLCWREVQLSDIDTRPGPFGNAQSIFNVAVQGTLSGQTRIRTVEGSTLGNTILGVTEEFWACTSGLGGVCTTGANLHFTGTRTKGDLLVLSPEGQ